MSDSDEFLRLYAHERSSGAMKIINLTQNEWRRRGDESDPYLVFKFSDPVTDYRGIVVGCAKDVDVHLPKRKGFSRNHFAFAFDDQHRPIVHDLGSKVGLRVMYNAEPGSRRSGFKFLLRGPAVCKQSYSILDIGELRKFRAVVSPYDNTSPDYIAGVSAFRQCMKQLSDARDLSHLELTKKGKKTPRPSRWQTARPDNGPVLVKDEIGRGAFGIVYCVWDATTGKISHALKVPLKPFDPYRASLWKRELKIMGCVKHEHIVESEVSDPDPSSGQLFTLKMEYLPLGSLHALPTPLTPSERMEVLCQLLSALEYLHGKEPPIAHRDIKPDNILVASRGPSGIHVKFGDFGLAKAEENLQTFCGTPEYLAPEIPVGRDTTANDTYTVAVDIWSLGLVIAKYECAAPTFPKKYTKDPKRWAKVVIAYFRREQEKNGSKLLRFLLDTMLVENPDDRKDAVTCLEGALALKKEISRIGTPTPSVPSAVTPSGPSTVITPSIYGTPTPSFQGTELSMVPTGASAATVRSSEVPTESRSHKRSRLGEPLSRPALQQSDMAATAEAEDHQLSEDDHSDNPKASKRRKVGEGSKGSRV
ncbi:kinase-like protein [Aaosphaeria arxii CBS 175.79]|uniref:non-specific serine/threonine protein kinase n=1 Tax=Aaosphaeria arxii CBS 175.79 TaxID=1450172 RepID=A0A6A5XLT9_9PLEO|nr:kinase-like protein [Aaosphaeria arxii CBS 175.79]KAF2014248.1 kinase-like protein [Aaosphaeria arxii CBS 175.79]